MKKLSALFALFTLFKGHVVLAGGDDGLRRTWTLYHSTDPKLGDAGFTKRGVVTLEPEDNRAKVTVENDENSFSAAEVEKMMSSGWYQLKLVEDGPKDSVPNPVMTTVPACHLRRANFR